MHLSVTLLVGFLAGALATPLPLLSDTRNHSTPLKKPITLYNQTRPLGVRHFNHTSTAQANRRVLEDRDLNQRAVTNLNVTRKVILKPTPRVPSLLKRDIKGEVEAVEGNTTAIAEKKSGLPKLGVVLLELIMNFTRREQNVTSNDIGVKVNITKTGDDAEDVEKEEESIKEAKEKSKGKTADDEDEDDKKGKYGDKDKDDDDDDDDDDNDDDDDDEDDNEDYKYGKGDDDEDEELKKEAEELKKEGDAAKEEDDEDTDDATEAKGQAKNTKDEAQQNKRTSGQSKEQTKAETKEIKEQIKSSEGSGKRLFDKRSANETDESHDHRHEVDREEFMRFFESVDKAEAPPNRVNP